MRKKLLPVGIAVILALVAVYPAAAITGGQPDGNGHPYGALLLVPGYTICSGTLIAADVVLTAGHCTSFWTEDGISEVMVTFDSQAAVDVDWEPVGGVWYVTHSWVTHPGYVDADWPFTADFGLVFLDEPVTGITPAALPEAGLVDQLIGTTGQTAERFYDVGYGQDGVNVGGGPYTRNFDFIRKVSEQRFNPSNGTVGTLDPMWLILGNNPSDNHGAGCGGDSGSGIFLNPASPNNDTVVAVHTGGYRMGYLSRLCGRITSLNHRVDLPVVLDWISGYLD
jgi:hypothetical protein